MMLNVPLEEAKHIAVGQNMTFQADGDDYRHVGKVTWISTNVDSHTRTIKVRGELPNHDDRLRDESFGTGEDSVCGKKRTQSSCPARRSTGKAAATSRSFETRTTCRKVPTRSFTLGPFGPVW